MREAGISPTKSLGQHFLTDANILNRIAAAASLTPDDTVIEVGPGLGALTQRLLEAAGHVIAVELDAKLADRLVKASSAPDDAVVSAAASPLLARRGVGGEVSPLTVIHADALLVSPTDLLAAASLAPETPYVVVGNLPYSAGTAIVRRFLEAGHQPQRLIVMLQREVAESMTAPPGEMGLLAVSVQVYAEVRRIFNVPARAFYPPPKVTSTVLRLDVRSEPLVPLEEIDSFFRVVRAGFSAPRKQLRNTLANGLAIPSDAATAAIDAAGLDGAVRPALLSVADWLRLSRVVGT